jgi:carboxyl-terminal processing protease
MTTMSRLPMPFRFVLILAIGVLVGFSLSVGPTVKAEREIEPPRAVPWRDARLLAEVLEHVRKEYVDNVSDQQLIESAIRGMIADLDPHSAFLDSEEFNEIRISTSGEYSGVGIEVALQDGAIKVVTPIDGAPAARAGVLAGDTIVAIDEIPVDAKDLNDTIDRMRGKAGTSVKLTVARHDEPKPLQFTLTRAAVQVHSVHQQLLEQSVGYVRISNFSETTELDLQRALLTLRTENGAALRGLVLDLRNNPGGLLDAAVEVSDTFLDSGIIVTANGRAADAKFEMDAKPGDMLGGAPIVVLVNERSASASEIVAGALKDHQRATLVGRQTFGKGSVQTVVPLSDGHAIKLTTSRYFTPSGASIHQRGITPDVIVAEPQADAQRKTDAQPIAGDLATDLDLRAALDVLKGKSVIRQSRAP